jgi:hypothetical protein
LDEEEKISAPFSNAIVSVASAVRICSVPVFWNWLIHINSSGRGIALSVP